MSTRPASIWCPSPNFLSAPAGRKVTCVVIHATETAGLDSPKAWLTNPESKVSAHYLIGTDGTIYHLVHEANVAYHAGESVWKGVEWVNHFSVGIELVNLNDGVAPYPEAQLAACAALVAAVCEDHGVAPEDVVGHRDIAPGRKTDPGAAFPWDAFRARLKPAPAA